MNKILILSLVVVSSLVTSCVRNEDATNEKETTTKNELTVDEVTEKIDALKKLNEELIQATPSATNSKAKALYNLAYEFANAYPDHEKTPAVLELAAKSSEVMGNYSEAVNILHKLINDFPESDETPKYMLTKAMVIEDRLKNVAGAKECYLELIARFPENQLAIDAKVYMENFLGKSQEEQFEFLDKQNEPK